MASDRELLERHVPRLSYDAQDPYQAMSAASAVDNEGNQLLAADGRVVAAQPAAGGPELTLAALAAYPDGSKASGGDQLSLRRPEEPDALRMQAQDRYANRCYGHVERGKDRIWLQYWLWLYYNPKHLLGFGRHQGDWEMVQVTLDAAERPLTVTCSQHKTGEAWDWERVPRYPEASLHPVVYLAPFSHALYFERRTHVYGTGIDHPAGDGPALEPRIEAFGPWSAWKGRWGTVHGWAGRILPSLNNGPQSPECQGKWRDPGGFEAGARRRNVVRQGFDVIWRLGRLTYPLEPIVEARLEGTQVTVDYVLVKTLLRRPRHLYVTAHAAGEGEEDEVLATETVRRAPARGSVSLDLPRELERVLVRASTFNAPSQRSDVAGVLATA